MKSERGLVERIRTRLHARFRWEGGPPANECRDCDDEARAIIREVAGWIDETSVNGGFHPAGFPEHVAETMRAVTQAQESEE